MDTKDAATSHATIPDDMRTVIEALDMPLAAYAPTESGVTTLALSKGFCDLFELEQDEAYLLMDHDMYRDTNPADRARIQEAAKTFTRYDAGYDVSYRTRGPKTHEEVTIRAQGMHVHVSGRRIAIVAYERTDPDRQTAETAAYETIRLVNYDNLTGLPNLPHFLDNVRVMTRDAQKTGETTAIAYVNIAEMDAFNITFGFEAGDRLLTSLAETMADLFGAESCARAESNHFTAICDANVIESKAHELIKRAKTLHDNWHTHLHVGIYVIDEETHPIESCDRAKYAADQNRGAKTSTITVFDEQMRKRHSHEKYVIAHIDDAIANGETQVWYQPVINASTHTPFEREALARWIRPSGEIIEPDDFIPTLERAKMLHKLDLFVIRNVMSDLARRQRKSLPQPRTSINVSLVDFERTDIVEKFAKLADEYDIDHSLICVEITERTAISDFEVMRKQMKRLHDLGFDVWIDDFGSGFSSLEALQELEFDLLKLDMSIVSRIDDSPRSREMVRCIVDMAKRLNLKVLAEGVETREQAEFLKAIGCDKLQGYLYGKPKPDQ